VRGKEKTCGEEDLDWIPSRFYCSIEQMLPFSGSVSCGLDEEKNFAKDGVI
jgi:hypothetical protein